jgi:flagellar motor switch protein FliM
VSPVNQILSQDEVDALLSAVDRGEISPASPPAAPLDRPILRYNFHKPNRVSKDQVRMLHSMHETFARLYTSSLTTLLRGLVEIELKNVEQVSHAEFVRSLAPPICLCIFNMEPLKGGAALEISANVLFLIIDRLLGGSGLMPVRPREFTEVEQVLIERVAIRAMLDLRQAWQHVGSFGFRVASLETNPQFVQLTSANEVVIVVTFDVRLGDVAGSMTLAFPHLLLEPIMPRLNTHRSLVTSQRTASAEEQEGLNDNLQRLRLTVRGVLAECPVTVRELLEMAPGDVLWLGRSSAAPAIVELEGVPRFTGRPGTTRTRKAIQLTGFLPKGEIIRDADRRNGSARVYSA